MVGRGVKVHRRALLVVIVVLSLVVTGAAVEDLLYVLTLTSRESEWQQYGAELDEIASSFVSWR